ncbi:hypothetical protein [Halalkalicoccus jeotgali]|uniref:Uncharacterized protein n=1 Tax=Halalkalicoccus jeotgali (strain DSM 18796 / CECT 7217 / JCM 14584 / KCTC 4019 / B3) TaxID=795797 RepID=D8J9M0_HALJB|nr:hypothetical protein [Halalkalicoccus jeotgali]ADJ14432.1 hypothetical protein HacjB3_05205 [Halalkalicoccus jeotgali B3]ELY40148.1 hypothetical protein C497_03590 [Halalkalicoccus jeotgali B3]
MAAVESPPYVLGRAPIQQMAYARFETKPPTPNGDTGAGYERWRSYEYRPETPGQEKEDVYVSHHRLLAVIACYPIEMPIEEVLEDLKGQDVHHNCPDVDGDRGIPWDNRHDGIEVLDHGEHSSITQAEMRAFAEDIRRERECSSAENATRCERCDTRDGPFGTADGFDGVRCLECAVREADGGPIDMGVGR